jgi:hypothetical protein
MRTAQMKKTSSGLNLLRLHAWLGIFTCIAILMWAVSGLSHPIMTHLQPTPVNFTAPDYPIEVKSAIEPRSILTKWHINSFTKLSIIAFNEESYLRVVENNGDIARYFNLSSGEELIDGDMQYATMLAKHFAGQPNAVISQQKRVNQFSDEYHAINRLLPVWRVDLKTDSELFSYIDTDQVRLSTLSDSNKQILTAIFRFGHNWSFLEAFPKLQIFVMSILIICVLLSATLGIFLYFKRSKQAPRNWRQAPLTVSHRKLGIVVALSSLMFASSGLFHLWVSFQQAQQTYKPATLKTMTQDLPHKMLTFLTSSDSPISRAELIQHQHQLYWLIHQSNHQAQVGMMVKESHDHSHREHTHAKSPYPFLVGLSQTGGQLDYANLGKLQSLDYSGLSIDKVKSTEVITNFNHEYGFIFKRLPVIKVSYQSNNRLRHFIEPSTGELAANMTQLDSIEGLSFALIHKWNFNGLNKNLRDILVSLFALGNLVLAMLGLRMFFKLKNKS